MQAASRQVVTGRPVRVSSTRVRGDKSISCRLQPSTATSPDLIQVVVTKPQPREALIWRAVAKSGRAADNKVIELFAESTVASILPSGDQARPKGGLPGFLAAAITVTPVVRLITATTLGRNWAGPPGLTIALTGCSGCRTARQGCAC